ncbi:MAG: hypothetical protein U1E46_10640 [Hyphomicrobiales bacterium]
MEFLALFVVVLAVVLVLSTWNDLAVVSGRLKRHKTLISGLDARRSALLALPQSEADVRRLDDELAEARAKLQLTRLHYDRIYSSFPGNRLAPYLGFAPDPLADHARMRAGSIAGQVAR